MLEVYPAFKANDKLVDETLKLMGRCFPLAARLHPSPHPHCAQAAASRLCCPNFLRRLSSENGYLTGQLQQSPVICDQLVNHIAHKPGTIPGQLIPSSGGMQGQQAALQPLLDTLRRYDLG